MNPPQTRRPKRMEIVIEDCRDCKHWKLRVGGRWCIQLNRKTLAIGIPSDCPLEDNILIIRCVRCGFQGRLGSFKIDECPSCKQTIGWTKVVKEK